LHIKTYDIYKAGRKSGPSGQHWPQQQSLDLSGSNWASWSCHCVPTTACIMLLIHFFLPYVIRLLDF